MDSHTNNNSTLISYFGLVAAEALLAFVCLLQQPSMPRRAVLLGFSAPRLILLVTMMLAAGLFLLAALRSWQSPSKLDRFVNDLEAWLRKGARWLDTVALLFFLCCSAVAPIIAWLLPTVHDPAWYTAAFEPSLTFEVARSIAIGAMPALVWVFLLVLQSLVVLLTVLSSRRLGLARVSWGQLYPRILLIIIGLATMFHWAILISHSTFFAQIPAWYPEIVSRPFTLRSLLILPFGLAVVLLAMWLHRITARKHWITFLVVCFALILQLVFGLLEYSEEAQLPYSGFFNSYHSVYPQIVVQDDVQFSSIIFDYEDRFGQMDYPGTKPPGVLLIYESIETLARVALGPQFVGDRTLLINSLLATVFPPISFLVVVLIACLLTGLTDSLTAYAAALYYVLLPNVILIALFLDQVLYPLLFVAGGFLLWKALQAQSFLRAILAGVFIYSAAYFSFSLLPLIPLAAIMLVLDYLRSPSVEKAKTSSLIGLGFLAGFVGLALTFQVLFGYSIVVRYSVAMTGIQLFLSRAGTSIEPVLTGLNIEQRIWELLVTFRLNITEFAIGIGFPVFILFLASSIRLLQQLLRRRLSERNIVLGAYLVTFLLLNASGQMEGEVARLWLFWAPMVAMFAAVEWSETFKNSKAVLLLIGLMQLVTIWLTFHFQNII